MGSEGGSIVRERRDTLTEKQHRIFVEWHDPNRPNWGGYVSSLSSDFQKELVDFVERCGPPTLVEFRAHDEGWEPSTPCEDCGKEYHECRCDGYDPNELTCTRCSQRFDATHILNDDHMAWHGICPSCEHDPCEGCAMQNTDCHDCVDP